MRSKLAITSFILIILGTLGILHAILFGIPPYAMELWVLITRLILVICIPVSFVTSIISLKIIKKKNLEGKKLAKTSLIISSTILGLFIIYFLLGISGIL
ncbi:hypothetical protein ACFLZJ_00250 [Nanoarchaeota archaeon]